MKLQIIVAMVASKEEILSPFVLSVAKRSQRTRCRLFAKRRTVLDLLVESDITCWSAVGVPAQVLTLFWFTLGRTQALERVSDMSIRPKQLTRIGEFYLQEAILDVLCSAHLEEFGLGPADISRRAGVYGKAGVAGMNDAIVQGFLNQLHEQRRVEQAPQQNGCGGWRLTDEEYDRRRDDMKPG